MPKEWHFVSDRCKGETCRCGNPATHKVGEEVPREDPFKQRHNFTAYVCCACFREIMGDAVFCPEEKAACEEFLGMTAAEFMRDFAASADRSPRDMAGEFIRARDFYADWVTWPMVSSTCELCHKEPSTGHDSLCDDCRIKKFRKE